MTPYGRVYYSNENGTFAVVECVSRSTYEKELAVAGRWLTDENKRRKIDAWGERLAAEVKEAEL